MPHRDGTLSGSPQAFVIESSRVGSRSIARRYNRHVAWPSIGMATAKPTKSGSEPSKRAAATMRRQASTFSKNRLRKTKSRTHC